MTCAVCVSGSTRTSFTLAGCSAFATSSLGFVGPRAPRRSSRREARSRRCGRASPSGPTHAPTGSTAGSFDHTAIFDRWPGSRATALISTTPSAISGTSSSKSFLSRPGCVRRDDDLRALGAAAHLGDVRLQPLAAAVRLARAPARPAAAGPRPSRGRAACTGARTCWTMPVTMSPSRPANSSYVISRSASRSFWKITCFAVCAPMRPLKSSVTFDLFLGAGPS